MNADEIVLDSRNRLPLTESNRLKLVDHAARFLLKYHGQYPNIFVKTMMAKAVITLFPCQKFKESEGDGIVSILYTIIEIKNKVLLFSIGAMA